MLKAGFNPERVFIVQGTQDIVPEYRDDEQSLFDRFAERHNIRAASNLTVTDFETAVLIAEQLAPRIEGKTVVEIGGGIGMLAVAMGVLAKRVYCIEANPLWSMTFAQFLLAKKPRNVSYSVRSRGRTRRLHQRRRRRDLYAFSGHEARRSAVRAGRDRRLWRNDRREP